MLINKTEISVSGRMVRIARVRHEWFEFLDNPPAFIEELRRADVADVATFLQEAHVERPTWSYLQQTTHASVLSFKNFDDWWKGLKDKARNQARKAQKTGVELRPARLDDDFLRGVKAIYDESPLRQGRKFTHYGKDLAEIREDLSSFPECTTFTGAYHDGRLIGFVKLFEGNRIMRIVHIIATFADRDKCPMDALMVRAVEMAGQKGIFHLHYGDWAHGGLGAFRLKYGFERHDCPRYFVPLNGRGALSLKLGLHRRFRDRIPQIWKTRAAGLRGKWNACFIRLDGSALKHSIPLK